LFEISPPDDQFPKDFVYVLIVWIPVLSLFILFKVSLNFFSSLMDISS
jgi:hypothetical protein